ncbi:MAG: hypothetical protein H6815_00290 [Phycisphaeraceae bacterium]|nr:hypothetical protein [Phycisphaerales bacterium]MCB9858862.1 hypothetical protein [Phycisphaeraceae bacterium]
MKRGGPEHPKIRRLAKALSVDVFAAVGVLECLYHWTHRYAVRGDIGRYSNEEIAEGVYWTDDAEKLVRALVDCGLVDECDTNRLVIHDWEEHADDYTKKKVKKLPEGFATPNKRDREQPRTIQNVSDSIPEKNGLPNHAVPCQSQRQQPPPAEVAAAADSLEPEPDSFAAVLDTDPVVRKVFDALCSLGFTSSDSVGYLDKHGLEACRIASDRAKTGTTNKAGLFVSLIDRHEIREQVREREAKKRARQDREQQEIHDEHEQREQKQAQAEQNRIEAEQHTEALRARLQALDETRLRDIVANAVSQTSVFRHKLEREMEQAVLDGELVEFAIRLTISAFVEQQLESQEAA